MPELGLSMRSKLIFICQEEFLLKNCNIFVYLFSFSLSQCMCVHDVHIEVREGLEGVGSHPFYHVSLKLRSSGPAAWVFTHWAISLAQEFLFNIKL